MNNTVFESFSSEDTRKTVYELGRVARPGQIYALDGDLGVGKTVFTKGFAEGLGVTEKVNSPTFTIMQMYDSGRLRLCHFDVYRIEDPEEMWEVGLDEYLGSDAVCLIEWADQIAELLPPETIRVKIEKDLSRGLDFRRITIVQPENN